MKWLLIVLFLGIANGSQGNSDIFLGLPLNQLNQFPIFELKLGTTSAQASYIVETLNGEIISGNTSYNQFATVTLPRELQVTSNEDSQRMKGIRVCAAGEAHISALLFMKYPYYSVNSAASLLVYPNEDFADRGSYEYFAISTDYTGSGLDMSDRFSAVLLIGNYNETRVSITPTQSVQLPGTGSTHIRVAAGSSYTVTLDMLHTLLISSINDLTGTRIVSNRPLTVLSGHQCAQVPSTRAFCEMMYVQVSPTITWGQKFLLAPFAGRTSNQFYKIVTSRNSTSIAYRCPQNGISEEREIAYAGNGEMLVFIDSPFCYLIASAPIFVVQLGAGFSVDSRGDPTITIISPTTGYVSSATFLTLSDAANNFISVTVEVEHFNESQIQLDGSQLMCTWTDILDITTDDVVGYGCDASVTAGTHVVSHIGQNGILSVVVYGWSSNPALGYAYLPAISLTAADVTTNNTPLADCACGTPVAVSSPPCTTAVTDAIGSVSSIVTMVCSIVFFIVGVVSGSTGGALVMYCCVKSMLHPQPPASQQLYEEIFPVNKTHEEELKLNENEAYGQIKSF